MQQQKSALRSAFLRWGAQQPLQQFYILFRMLLFWHVIVSVVTYRIASRPGIPVILVIYGISLVLQIVLLPKKSPTSSGPSLIMLDFVLISFYVHYMGGVESQAFWLYMVEFHLLATSLCARRFRAPLSLLGLASFSVAALMAPGGPQRSSIFLLQLLSLSLAATFANHLGLSRDRQVRRAREDWLNSQRQLETHRLLAEINQRLLAEWELEKLLVVVLDGAGRLLTMDGGLLTLVDGQGRHEVVQTAGCADGLQGLLPADSALLQLIEQAPGVGRVCLPSSEEEYHAIYVPLKLEGAREGAIVLLRRQASEEFAGGDLEKLQAYAPSATMAISGALLYARLERRGSQLMLLNEIGRSIAATLDMEQLFETMYRGVARVMPAEAFFVAFYDERAQEIEIKYMYDLGQRYPEYRYAVNDGPTSLCILSGEPVIWNVDSRQIPGVQHHGVTTKFVQSMMVVPMKLEGRVIGAISAQSYTPAHYDEEQVQLLGTVASQAAIAFSNARLYARARELSLTDSMTGLANARRFYQELEARLAAASQSGSKVSLLMIDSDCLKQINDSYGHPAGDKHILNLASVIRSHVRSTDLAARYAGDEFMVVLPDADRDEAMRVGERIRRHVMEQLASPEQPDINVTVSVGVAVYPDDASSAENLFRQVDRALYKAKRQGRNRVRTVSPAD